MDPAGGRGSMGGATSGNGSSRAVVDALGLWRGPAICRRGDSGPGCPLGHDVGMPTGAVGRCPGPHRSPDVLIRSYVLIVPVIVKPFPRGNRGVGCGARLAASGWDRDRAEVIACYQRRLETTPRLLAKLPELRGKALACWCPLDREARAGANACHADVLLELLGRHTDAELRAMGDGR